MMNRRTFNAALASAAQVWPLSTRAQQPARLRRIGVLTGWAENEPEAQARVAPLRQELANLGWLEGSNVRLDFRWRAGDDSNARTHAAELVALAPDVILVNGITAMEALVLETTAIPTVFVNISEPAIQRWAASLALPGSNVTGFAFSESGLFEKWLQMLKEAAPHITRVLYLNAPRTKQWVGIALENTAPLLGLQLITSIVRNAAEIEQAVKDFASQSNGGMVVMPSTVAGGRSASNH